MGIEVLFNMFQDTRTPEQKAEAEANRIKAEAEFKKRDRIFLAEVFLAVAGIVGIGGAGGYWLGTHSAHVGQNNCAATSYSAPKR